MSKDPTRFTEETLLTPNMLYRQSDSHPILSSLVRGTPKTRLHGDASQKRPISNRNKTFDTCTKRRLTSCRVLVICCLACRGLYGCKQHSLIKLSQPEWAGWSFTRGTRLNPMTLHNGCLADIHKHSVIDTFLMDSSRQATKIGRQNKINRYDTHIIFCHMIRCTVKLLY